VGQRSRDDRAAAVSLGEEFGLGELRMVARVRRDGPAGLRSRAGTTGSVSVSGVPNGVFLAHLVEHAAARNGVPVLRRPRNLSDRIALGASGASSHDRENI